MSSKNNILITSAGHLGFIGTIYSIREVFKDKVIGVSSKYSAIGDQLTDAFYVVQEPQEEEFLKKILQICLKQKVKIVIPHSIRERMLFMKNKALFTKEGVSILSSSVQSIEQAENKLYFMNVCKELAIPVPKHYVVTTKKELKEKIYALGYPKEKVVVKPVVSRGSRGFRIVTRTTQNKASFFYQRAGSTQITCSDLMKLLNDTFPELMVSEFLPGEEYTIDCLRQDKIHLAIPRERIEVKEGLTTVGRLSHNDELINYSKKLAKKLNLTTVFGFQFKRDKHGVFKALECNPRIQGTMIMSTLAGANIIATSAQLFLKQKITDFDIDWNLEFFRTWSGISLGKNSKIINFKKGKQKRA